MPWGSWTDGGTRTRRHGPGGGPCAPSSNVRGAGPGACARVHRVEIRDGHPVDVLLAAADDEHAGLIIVGIRGVGDRLEAALGSTSLRVLQAARVPVLVVPDRGPGTPGDDGLRLRHLLVGAARSETSRAALGLAADVGVALGGSLSVLEVVDYVPPFPLTNEPGEPAPALAMELIEAEVRDVRERGVGVQVIVRTGDPATLLEVADDVDADLVVVGNPRPRWTGRAPARQRRPDRGRPGPSPNARRTRRRDPFRRRFLAVLARHQRRFAWVTGGGPHPTRAQRTKVPSPACR
jgi:nucleotide-binding universal stress UspA family protein